MSERSTSDLNVVSTELLPPPEAILAELPLTDSARQSVVQGRAVIRDILDGKDDRLLVIAGPCSVHDRHSMSEYADRFAELSARVQDRVHLVMRTYFEKPRTTVGWKGLIYDPNLDDSYDIEAGIRLARTLMLEVVERGIPTAIEFLDPIVPQYLADLTAWAAMGARTTESQTHRQMASGLSVPVGFKNGTAGSVQIAVDAILSARAPHAFLGIARDGRTSIVRTAGNEYGHLVLRGGSEGPNYRAPHVESALQQLAGAGLPERLVVDCSHANSSKDHTKQAIAFRDVLGQRVAGNRAIVGVMLESHLNAGRQSLGDDPAALEYGVSITDACIGWDETEQLLNLAHEQLGAPVPLGT